MIGKKHIAIISTDTEINKERKIMTSFVEGTQQACSLRSEDWSSCNLDVALSHS